MRRLLPAAVLATVFALAVPAHAEPKVQCKPGYEQVCEVVCVVYRPICIT